MSVRLGTWLTLGSPAIAEIVCKAGFDWVCVDLEHSTTSLETAEALLRVIDLCGKRGFVRLSTKDDAVQIKRVLDSGAHGLIVPMINSAEDVERVVLAMHYPPRGHRGVGLARAQAYGPGFEAYRRRLAEEVELIVQIEHADALPHLDAIFASEDVGGCMIGPYDLTASMGIAGQFDHPDAVAAMSRIAQAAQSAGVAAGIHVVEPDPAALKQRIDEGYTFIAYSVDFRMIDAASRLGLDVLDR